MAERIIAGRKSQMFLHSVIPVVDTHEEMVKKKLKGGKFPFTITGIIKLIGMVFLLTALLIFVINSRCVNKQKWFPYLLPSVLGVHLGISLLLYLTFSLGLIMNNPRPWIKIDILTNLSISTATIIASVSSIKVCTSNPVGIKMPMILGLCGGGTLIVSCAALFLMYRYTEDKEDNTQRNPTRPMDPRKSVFA